MNADAAIDLCLVTTCMGRLTQLRESLGPAASQPGTACVVVDFSCPDGTGEWVRTTFPSVRVVTVAGRTRFNISEARNAGAAGVAEPWIVFFDSDVILLPGFAEMLRPLLQRGCYYRARPHREEFCGSFVCHRSDFERVGGFDEVMQGYGAEDYDMFDRLKQVGLREASFPADLMKSIPHPNTLRTQFYDVKKRWYSDLVNKFYARVKLDAMSLTRSPLPLVERQALYGRVQTWVDRCFAAPDTPARLEVSLRRQTVKHIGRLDTILTYVLTPQIAWDVIKADEQRM